MNYTTRKKSSRVYKGPKVWILCEKLGKGKFYGFSIESVTRRDIPMPFTKAQTQKLFEGIKRVFEEVLPHRKVNPWNDSHYGTPDFE